MSSDNATRERVEAILGAIHAKLASGQLDEGTIPEAIASLQSLAPTNEVDRVHQLLGFVQLCDLILEHLPGDAGDALRADRTRIAEVIQRQYGSTDTPYVRSRTIVEETAARLVAGEPADEVASAALAQVASLAFDEADEPARSVAALAVQALRVAHEWLAAPATLEAQREPAHAALRSLAEKLDAGAPACDVVRATMEAIRAGRWSLDGSPNGHASAILIAYGLGVRAAPTSLPGFEPTLRFVNEAFSEAATAPAAPAEPDFAARCDAILAAFAADTARDGFSEHAFRQANEDLKELQARDDADVRTLNAALVRLVDLAVPQAPREVAETLLVVRASLLDFDAPPKPPLGASELRAEGEAILDRLRDELARGDSVSPSVMRAITAMQSLGARVRDDDEEGTLVVLRLMPEVTAIAAAHAPAEKQALAEDASAAMRGLMSEVDAMLSDDSPQGEIAKQAAMREMTRFVDTPTSDPFEAPDAPAQQRQFAAMVRPFAQRVASLRANTAHGTRDATEAARIADRADSAFRRLRAATTEAQWIEQQRSHLRRVALELRRFERRRHVMAIAPAWPTTPAAIDANAVFFCGGDELRATVARACERIGMSMPLLRRVDDATHARWDALRTAGLALFDFTEYDRAASDPPGPLPTSRDALAAIALAAAPAARAAYECGWALVLGVPIVTIAREGQGLPFDIDIEAVRVTGDADLDATRLALGMQAAMFGTQREARAEDLRPTIAWLRARLSGDREVRSLLDGLEESKDAMHAQFAMQAALERANATGLALVVPAFAPRYPSVDAPRTLFHVTGFRPWAKPCEDALRAACERTGIEYRIGYERLDPDILRAVWDDVGGASLVVADLTNLNPNAALELAVAQALGRPTLVVSQTPDLHTHLPALAKVRTHSYATDAAGIGALAQLVERAIRDALESAP
ncbi:MAG: hypothetical protein U0572_12875 [Phycisphaerales bacterium]